MNRLDKREEAGGKHKLSIWLNWLRVSDCNEVVWIYVSWEDLPLKQGEGQRWVIKRMEQANRNEKVKQALQCFWVGYIGLGCWKKGWWERRRNISLTTTIRATSSACMQSLDLSGWSSIPWSCCLNFLNSIWLWRLLNKKYFGKERS